MTRPLDPDARERYLAAHPRETALNHVCPVCLADPGFECLRSTRRPHAVRRRLAWSANRRRGSAAVAYARAAAGTRSAR